MILREINKEKEKREELLKIKEFLKDVQLPKKYKLEDNEINSYKWKFRYETIAKINLENENIIVTFEDEEEFNRLKPLFEKSKNFFILQLNKESYY